MSKKNQIEMRTLPCVLDTDQVASYAYELARKEGEAIKLEIDKKAVQADFKGKVDLLRAEIALFAKKVETRSEDRLVECEVRLDEKAGQAEIVRLDTGEIVTRRPMTDFERQKPLPLTFEIKG